MFTPGLRFDTFAEGLVPSENIPVPLSTVQAPFPVAGVSPFKVRKVPQMEVSLPALAFEGGRLFITITSSKVEGQLPVVTVNRKTFVPNPRPETDVLNKVLSAKVPCPETTVHCATPGNASTP